MAPQNNYAMNLRYLPVSVSNSMQPLALLAKLSIGANNLQNLPT